MMLYLAILMRRTRIVGKNVGMLRLRVEVDHQELEI